MHQEWLGDVVDRDDLTRHDKWLCMIWPRLKLLRELLSEDGAIFVSIDGTHDAWKRIQPNGRKYEVRLSGTGEEVPTVCFKIPTGGGKTLVAVKSIDAINNIYRGSHTGLVLWIVPTQQIYRQRLQVLRDKAHPHRQMLDIGSGGKTRV